MKLNELLNKDVLDQLIADKYISVRKHPTAELYIYNYTAKCQFDRNWNHETRTCRGLIADSSGNVLARPFPKFFNFGENGVDKLPDEPFEVYDKLDGSLGILHWVDGEPAIATRGSFDSPQARWATEFLRRNHGELFTKEQTQMGGVFGENSGYTFLFEILFKANRVVVDYGDREELVLLACLHNESGYDIDPHKFDYLGFPIVERFDGLNDYDQIMALEKENAEGVVLHFKESNTRMKVKYAEYKRLHRLMTGVSPKSIWEELIAVGHIENFIERVPDEFYDWATNVRNELNIKYEEIERACAENTAIILAEVEKALGTKEADCEDKALFKKTLAEKVVKCENPHIIFSMINGKDYRLAIWKLCKPNSNVVFKIENDVVVNPEAERWQK